jgi:tetratricopeptide (TPR) repeat protein
LVALAFHFSIQGRLEEALTAVREALVYARASGDRRLLAQGLLREAMGVFPNDVAQGRKLFDEAVALFTACDDLDGSCITLLNRAELEFQVVGDAQGALRFAEGSLPMARSTKNRDRIVTNLGNCAAYHNSIKQFDDARACAHESLMLARDAQSWQTAAFDVQHLAMVALHKGDAHAAARLLGWVDARLRAIDEMRQSTEQREYLELTASLQQALSEAQLQAFLAEGALLPDDAAMEEALRI